MRVRNIVQVTSLIGIDCATQPKKVGLALGRLRDGVVVIEECRTASRGESPAEIASVWISQCEKALLALDAPLGWPLALGSRLRGHRAGLPMGAAANELFRRTTDDFVWGRLGKRPLEVGADRISRTAVAALGMLDEIRIRTGHPIPLAWTQDEPERFRVIEVYPAATRLAHRSSLAGGSIAGLESALGCSRISSEAKESADAMDAAVCVLAAGDFILGRVAPPVDQGIAEIEGWIWVARLQNSSSSSQTSA